MTAKYEIIEVNNVEVSVDVSLLIKSDTMFFNATEMAKSFGKRPNDFLNLDSTGEYIELLLEDLNTISNGIYSREDLIQTKRGKKFGGTWLRNELALRFARWLSVRFEYNLDKWITRKLKEEQKRKEKRLASKTGYLDLSKAIQDSHEEPKNYHYSNEANMLNRIILGMTAKEYREKHQVDNVRDNLTVAEIEIFDKMQKQDTALIDFEYSYQERKEKLESYYSKLKQKYIE